MRAVQALFLGLIAGLLGAVLSLAVGTQHVWPGVVVAFLVCSLHSYLILRHMDGKVRR